MATNRITTRQELIEYCLRRLGYPVIEINIDPDQMEDRIDDAFQFYNDYHYDAVEKTYIKYTLTQDDITNQYLAVDDSIIGISRIFPMYDTASTNNMFDIRYQLRLNELYDFTSASYVNYTLTMQHIRTLNLLFVGEIPIDFSRHQNRLYPRLAWNSSIIKVGTVIIAEAYKVLDPDVYTDVYNDRWLKRYATVLFKRQWAENIKKFGNVTLPGGVFLNGNQMYMEALTEIDALELEMLNRYTLPVEMMMG